MPVFQLVPITANQTLDEGGYFTGASQPPCGTSPCLYGASTLLEAISTDDSKYTLFTVGPPNVTGVTRVSTTLGTSSQLMLDGVSSVPFPFPSGFLVLTGKIKTKGPGFVPPSYNSNVNADGYYYNGNFITSAGSTSCGTDCILSASLPIAGIGVSALTFGNYGVRSRSDTNPSSPNVTRVGIDALFYIGTYTLWSTQITLALNDDFTIATVTDGALQLLEPDQILVNGVATTILTQSAGSLTFTMPAMVGGVDYIIEGYVSGVGYVYFGYVTIPDYSGIYVAGNAFSGPGRDQYYDRSTIPPTTIGVKIPNPTIRTGFISDEDNYE